MNELFYLDLEGRMVSVRMPGSDPTKAETPRVLFSTGVAPSSAIDQFAVVGDRFLVRIPASADFNGSIEVIMNWTPPR